MNTSLKYKIIGCYHGLGHSHWWVRIPVTVNLSINKINYRWQFCTTWVKAAMYCQEHYRKNRSFFEQRR